MLNAYLQSLTGRIFKILPMKEQMLAGDGVYLDRYLATLSLEMQGASRTFLELQESAEYIALLNTVNGLCEDTPLPFLKREVFKMLSLVDKLKAEYGGDGV